MTLVNDMISEALHHKATDIHITCGSTPFFRKNGNICGSLQSYAPIDEDFFLYLLRLGGISISQEKQKLCYDFSVTLESVRIRCHIYRTMNTFSGALRILETVAPSIEGDINKETLIDLCKDKAGLVIIAGPTGSGKSYTLASLLEYINTHYAYHIITIEDPIEIIFTSKKALIHQREVGNDVASMYDGIHEALREDPDVVMIGEMRDHKTIEAAIKAAETGHLVFATMHTNRACDSVSRILSSFPAEKSKEARLLISQVLKAVVCQRLQYVQEKIYPIRDILLNTASIANLIRQEKDYQIPSVQECDQTMVTFSESEYRINKLLKY